MMGFCQFWVMSLLFSLVFWVQLTISIANTSENVENDIKETIDDLVRDLTFKYSSIKADEFWHPYVFGTGNENREIIHVSNAQLLTINGDYSQWKYARLGLKHYIIGISSNTIDVFGSDFKKVASGVTPDKLVALAVFTRWIDEYNHAKLIILVATDDMRLVLYHLENNKIVQIGSFPLHYRVREIELCHFGPSTKAVIVAEDINVPTDIYNVDIGENNQIWFFQRLPDAGSSNVVVYDSDMLDSIIAVSKESQVDIYTYEPKAGLYSIYQSIKIPNPCRRLFSFTLAYQHFIGFVPLDRTLPVGFISYDYDKNEYTLAKDNFGNITAAEVYPVAVADYRNEYFLVVQGYDKVTHIMSYHGRQVGFEVEYTCKINEDPECPPAVDLRRGIGFRYNEQTAYVFPGDDVSKKSKFLLIVKEVRNALSPLVEQSNNLYSTFYELSKRFAEWDKGVLGVQQTLQKSIQRHHPNTILRDWELSNLDTSNLKVDQDYDLESQSRVDNIFREFKFLNDTWTSEDFSTDLLSISSELNILEKGIEYAQGILVDAVLVDYDQIQIIHATQNISGYIISNEFDSKEIIVGTIIDYQSCDKVFEPLVLKSQYLKVLDNVIFNQKVIISKLSTRTLNEIEVSNIALKSQENIFECITVINGTATFEKDVIAGKVNGGILAEEIVYPYRITGWGPFHNLGLNFTDGFVVTNETKTSGSYDFDKIVLRSTYQKISSPINFASLLIKSHSKIDMINEYNFTEFVASIITQDYVGKVMGKKEIQEGVTSTTLSVTKLWNNHTFPDSFVQNYAEVVVITSDKNFFNVTANKVYIEGNLDGYAAKSYLSLTYPMEIYEEWIFKGLVSIYDDISVKKTVDGVDLEDFKKRDSLDERKESYMINGDVEFESEVYFDSLSIKEQINKKQFEDAFGHLLLFKGKQCEILGDTIILTSLTVDNMYIENGKVNEIPLDNILNTNQEQNVTGNMQFNKGIRFGSLYALNQYDSIDLFDLVQNAIHLKEINKITWKTHFNNMICGGDMLVEGPINEVYDYYGNKIAVTSGRRFQRFSGNILFQNLILNSLEVENAIKLSEGNYIGGMDVSKWAKDRISLSRDEQLYNIFEIEGLVKASTDFRIEKINDISLARLYNESFRYGGSDLIFSEYLSIKSVKVEDGTIYFDQGVSNYSFDEISNEAFPLYSDRVIQLHGHWHFQSIRVTGKFSVKGDLCGVDLWAFENEIIRNMDPNVEMYGSYTFNNIEVDKLIQSSKINDISIDDILTRDGNQAIDCHMKFNGNVYVNGEIHSDGSINNVSIASLKELYPPERKNSHTINGDFYLDHITSLSSLKVKGNFQNEPLSEYLSKLIKTSDPDIKFTEENIFLREAIIKNDVRVDYYNTIDMLNFKVLKLTNDITLTGVVSFEGIAEADMIEVSQGYIKAEEILGVNWKDLIDNSIPKNYALNQNITKNLNFDQIDVKKVMVVDKFQGDYFKDFISLNENQNINHLKVNTMKYYGSDLPVRGNVLGYNLSQEYEDSLLEGRQESYYLSGNKTFTGSVRILEAFNCIGPSFIVEAVDITSDFYISSPVEFEKQLNVEGNVQVSKPLDGYSIDSIMSEALTQDDNQPITGEWEFTHGITFKQNVEGEGDFKDFDIQALIDTKNAEIAAVQKRIARQKQIYREVCREVVNATEDFVNNPMKLDAFDSHQSIILRHQVDKVVTLVSANKIFLLTSSTTCEIVKYEMKFNTELFYQTIDSKQNRLHLGLVKDWHSATLGNTGILVFYTEKSECSTLETGVYFIFLERSGKFSKVFPLLIGNIKALNLVSDSDTGRAAAFVLRETNVIQIFSWDQDEEVPPTENEIALKISYDAVELTLFDNEVGVLFKSKTEFAVYIYDWSLKLMQLIAKKHHDSGKGTINAIFQNYGSLYVVLPQVENQLSNLKSPCTLQIFKVFENDIWPLHPLSIQGLVSSTMFEFSHQPYLTALSKTHGINIYKFMGLNGMQLMNTNPIKIFNGYQVYSFNFKPWSFSAVRPFLMVLTGNTIEVFHSVVYGDSFDVNYKKLCRVY